MCEFFEQHQLGAFQEGSRVKALADSLTAAMSEHGIQLDNIRKEVAMADVMIKSIIIKKCFISAIKDF